VSKYELTDEQKAILNSVYTKDKIIKVNAFAGASKTTSIIETVKEIRKNDKDCKILYLVFNRSMIQDSKKKFDILGLDTECYTTNAFALRRFSAINKKEISIMNNIDYNDYLSLKNKNERYKYCKYKNVVEMFNQYCMTYDNLDKFCGNLKDKSSKEKYGMEKLFIKTNEVDFFKDLYKYFINNDKYLHQMYMKEYACNCPDLIKSYKYIFIDEVQDVAMMALPILKRMRCEKMYLVGDSFQKIYSFLKTVNVFDKFEGPTYPLSVSFRFNDEICKIANDILAYRYAYFKHGSIKNYHNETELKVKNEKTLLFRLNSELFEYAVDLIKENDNIKVKFMDTVGGDNVDGFDGAFSEMLYFYSKLLESKPNSEEVFEKFKEKFAIKYSKNVESFVKIANKEGYENRFYQYLCLPGMRNILPLDLLKYFNFFLMNERDILNILQKVKNSEDITDYNFFYTLITSHRAKGLEWDFVKVCNGKWSLNSDDEANLLYVACTRARYKLDAHCVKLLLEEKYATK